MELNRKLKRGFSACVVLALSLFAGSCIDLNLGPPTTATLAVCPIDQTQSTSSVIGSLGGTVTLNGSSVVLPAGALLNPTTIALTIPASQYMEIGVTANGGSIVFQKPISITIDYSRCPDNIKVRNLSVWQIDPNTKQLLQFMGGVDNKVTDQITITPLHLSGYALAF
jgi:hypothetical protein